MAERISGRIVEIRSYRLKPGTAEAFDRLVKGTSFPMLRRQGIGVVAFGPSLQDKDAYYLMRAYASLEDLDRSEATFYGSNEWRHGPRGAFLACIEHYTSVVIEVEDATVEGLRSPSTRGRTSSGGRRTGPDAS